MLTLLIAAAAQAVTPSSVTAPSAAAAEDKMVCQYEQQDAGSRISTKVCLKQSERDAIAKQTQEDLDSSRNDRGIAPNPE